MIGKMPPEGELPSDRQAISNTLKIAWPSMLESFLIALVGVVDTIMVGQLGSSAIAAVGLTNQPKFICLAVFMALCVALSAIVARRRGEQNRESANRVLVQALVIALVFVIIISTLAVTFAEPIMVFAGGEQEIVPQAATYFRIIIGGLLFNVITLVINAAQRGAGNTKITMRTNIVSNAVNVVLNYLLIGGNFGFPALGVRGAAIATVIGSVAGCIMSIASVMKKKGFLSLPSFPGIRFDSQNIKSLINVGSSALVEQLFVRVGFFMYSIVVAKLGTTDLAAHLVGMNILSLSFSIGDGLSSASVALVGRSLGQRRRDLARMYGNLCVCIGLVFAAFLALVFMLLGKYIFMLFTDDAALLVHQEMLITMIVIIVTCQIPQVILFGCLRGSGDTRFTAVVSMVSITLIRPFIGWALSYPMGLGLLGAWIGVEVDQALCLVLTWLRFSGGKWMNHKV